MQRDRAKLKGPLPHPHPMLPQKPLFDHPQQNKTLPPSKTRNTTENTEYKLTLSERNHRATPCPRPLRPPHCVFFARPPSGPGNRGGETSPGWRYAGYSRHPLLRPPIQHHHRHDCHGCDHDKERGATLNGDERFSHRRPFECRCRRERLGRHSGSRWWPPVSAKTNGLPMGARLLSLLLLLGFRFFVI